MFDNIKRKPLNVEAWLSARGVKYKRKPQKSGNRTVWQITCPHDPTHESPDACITQDDRGMMGARCLHASCEGKGYRSFAKAIGLPGKEFYAAGRSDAYGFEPEEHFDLGLITSEEFGSRKYERNYLIDGLIAEGESLIVGGPKKVLKTSLCVDLMISMATGTNAFGQFEVQKPTPGIIISGESGECTLQDTARAVAQSKGYELYEVPNLHWGFTLPRIADPAHCNVISEMIEATGAKTFFVDPAYLALLAGAKAGTKSSDLFAMGPILKNYSDIGQETGCVMCLVHHTTKSVPIGNPLELNDLSGSGFAEWARQWLIINRRAKFDIGSGFHELCLTVGGSAGHAGAYALDADEGRTDGELITAKTWSVSVKSFEAAKAEERAEKDAKVKADQEIENGVVRAAVASDENGVSANRVRQLSGFGADRARKILDRLLVAGEIEVEETRVGQKIHTTFTVVQTD